MKKIILALLCLLAIILLLVLIYRPDWLPTTPSDDRPGDLSDPSARLETMRLALAETENLNPDAAEPLWLRLRQMDGDDTDSLQNLVVTRLSRLNQLRAKLNDVSLSETERQSIEEEFGRRAIEADEALDDLRAASLSNDDLQLTIAAAWFSGMLDRQQTASNLTEQDRREIGQTLGRLTESLSQFPQAVPLVGLIDELTQLASDPIEGISQETARQLVPALTAAAKQNPRNLYVAATALNYALIAEDPVSGEIAMAIQRMVEPFVELVRNDAGGLDLDTLGSTVDQYVREGDYRRARSLQRPWMNLLRGTEMMKVDRKAANPNVLDFVATDSINRLATALASENEMPTSSTEWRFAAAESIPTGLADPRAVTPVDFDLNGTVEIAAADNDKVVILRFENDAWQEIASRSIRGGVRGITQAELFPADSSDRLRITRPAQETFGETEAEPDDEDIATLARSHDAYPQLILWGQQGIEIIRLDGRTATEPANRLLAVQQPTGLEELADILAITAADIDADGDLDLVVSSESEGVSIWVNRGNLTFFPVTRFSQPPTAGDPVIAMSIGDLDRDLDIDIAVLQRSGTVGWLENLLHLQMRWKPVAAIDPVTVGEQDAAGVAVVEWDGNVSWDIAYAGRRSLGVLETETTGIGVVRPLDNHLIAETAAEPSPGVGGNLRVADLDNDSWPDLLTFGPDGASVLRGGGTRLSDLPTTSLTTESVSSLSIADFNSDGRLDICWIQDSQVHVVENQMEAAGNFIDVQMKGIDDNATGRVNQYAIGSTLELRFGPHYRAQTIDSRTTHFGIGALEAADTLRAILTNGVTQNVIDPPANSLIVEEQSLKGSCPYLYTWDGEKFVFVTDCLWAAPLGLQTALGSVVPDRPWEYLKIDGDFLKPRDGKYEIRLTEELWELAYFDHVSLIAVDHPADVQMWTNEKVGPPEVTAPKTYAIDATRPVVAARDSQGRDCAEMLADRDQRYVQGFDRRILQGLCPTHWIELDLGSLAADDRALLLLTGWILPTDSSLNIQISQNPDLPSVQPPSVWIPDGKGEWVCSIPAMGFPGGKTKTIVVDLTGKLNPDDTRVRIQTSAEIYWDAAELAVNPAETQLRETPLKMLDAEIAYRGFSAQLPRTSTQPHRYDYDEVSRSSKWPPLGGYLTREGDCLQLLAKWDDAMVVIGGGDEIKVSFAVPEHAVPDGWKRDFILHSVGWDKDADLNTLDGQQIGPLPFRGMTAYPPPAADREKARQVEMKNDWHLTREQNFRNFWSRN
jgi:hypothetical protein